MTGESLQSQSFGQPKITTLISLQNDEHQYKKRVLFDPARNTASEKNSGQRGERVERLWFEVRRSIDRRTAKFRSDF